MKKKKVKVLPKKMGRPSKIKQVNIEHLKFLISKGCTDEEICQFFKISRPTFWKYQQTIPEFLNTIQGWKKDADERVERSLYERAIGYSHQTEEIFCAFGVVTRVETVKQYAPDVLACAIWLKNRQPDKWREKQPDQEDESLKDQELVFHDVPNQKDPKAKDRFAKYMNAN